MGRSLTVTDATVRDGIDYIKKHPGIRDVLLSGGDPLMLDEERLDEILTGIRDLITCRVGERDGTQADPDLFVDARTLQSEYAARLPP